MKKLTLAAIAMMFVTPSIAQQSLIPPSQATPLQPVGTMPATMPGSGASLGYIPDRFTPVPDLTTSSGLSRSPSWLPPFKGDKQK
jgi:hypothetical protein